MTRTTSAAVAAAIAMLLGGCGSRTDGGADPDFTPAPTTAPLESVAPGINEDDPDVDPLDELGVARVAGPFLKNHPDGSPMARGSVRDGQIDGDFERWYPNGQVKERGRFDRGHEVGTWNLWHPNGQPYEVMEFAGGEEHGRWVMFHDNGRAAEEMTWAEGRQQGLQTDYDRDGRKVGEGSFRDDRPVGEWTCFDPDGTVRTIPAPKERYTPREVCTGVLMED